MNIIIDAMGGDNAPLEIVKGALSAHARFDCDITLTGDETAIRAAAAQCGAAQLPAGVAIHPTTFINVINATYLLVGKRKPPCLYRAIV